MVVTKSMTDAAREEARSHLVSVMTKINSKEDTESSFSEEDSNSILITTKLTTKKVSVDEKFRNHAIDFIMKKLKTEWKLVVESKKKKNAVYKDIGMDATPIFCCKVAFTVDIPFDTWTKM